MSLESVNPVVRMFFGDVRRRLDVIEPLKACGLCPIVRRLIHSKAT